MLFETELHSPSFRIGTMSGFICARYTIAHLTTPKNKMMSGRLRVKRKGHYTKKLYQRLIMIKNTHQYHIVTDYTK